MRQGGDDALDFEISGTAMSGFVQALRQESLFDAVYARSSEAARAVLEQPGARRWHPSPLCLELNRNLLALGVEAVTQVNYRAAKDSFRPILMPALKVALVFGGVSPPAIFSRLNHVLRVTNRGLSSAWESRDGRTGVFTVEYGSDCPDGMVEGGWRGLLKLAAELLDLPLHVERFEPVSPRVFRFYLRW